MARISEMNQNEQAVDFTLPSGDGTQIRLSDYRGRNVVLCFYPFDWSPVCGNELTLISEVLEEVRSYNAEVLAISCDSTWSHRAWAKDQGYRFPLLSDFWPHGGVAQQYGVFRAKEGCAERSVFFIDSQGIVRDSWVSEDPTISPGIDVIFGGLEQIEGRRPEETAHA